MDDSVFYPSRTLTFETVQGDTSRLMQLLRKSSSSGICLNLSNVEHCDSTGLALLIEAKRICRRHNKTFQVENMPSSIEALAKFCGVDVIINDNE